VDLDNWASLKQMWSLRSVLLEGTQRHLESNPVVRGMFGLGAPLNHSLPADKLSALQKRAMFSPNSAEAKARTMRRDKQRAHRGQRNMAILADE